VLVEEFKKIVIYFQENTVFFLFKIC